MFDSPVAPDVDLVVICAGTDDIERALTARLWPKSDT